MEILRDSTLPHVSAHLLGRRSIEIDWEEPRPTATTGLRVSRELRLRLVARLAPELDGWLCVSGALWVRRAARTWWPLMPAAWWEDGSPPDPGPFTIRGRGRPRPASSCGSSPPATPPATDDGRHEALLATVWAALDAAAQRDYLLTQLLPATVVEAVVGGATDVRRHFEPVLAENGTVSHYEPRRVARCPVRPPTAPIRTGPRAAAAAGGPGPLLGPHDLLRRCVRAMGGWLADPTPVQALYGAPEPLTTLSGVRVQLPALLQRVCGLVAVVYPRAGARGRPGRDLLLRREDGTQGRCDGPEDLPALLRTLCCDRAWAFVPCPPSPPCSSLPCNR